jgi:DNA-binding transcriptional MerR regulator|tara:strand:+ start:4712 stop:4999 length:288 start_codon:yes stop_codon:yes gene_type:complete
MNQIVDFERRIEFALDEIERAVSQYSKSSNLDNDHVSTELMNLTSENERLEALIERLKLEHKKEVQTLLAEREEERETVKELYKRLTEVVENPGD